LGYILGDLFRPLGNFFQQNDPVTLPEGKKGETAHGCSSKKILLLSRLNNFLCLVQTNVFRREKIGSWKMAETKKM
jgi:hypothetical protein